MKIKKLSTKHTPEKLAEAIVFPVTLSQARKKESGEQLAAARKERQKVTFGHFLKQYVDLFQIKNQFAEDISIDETLLSQFINQHRTSPDYMAIRLEIHSNNTIPAAYWLM